jgi:hypothetical protein
MTLEGIEGMSVEMQAMVVAVREYMRDYPELNRLTAGQESSNRMIAFAIQDAVSQYNMTPPMTRIALRDILALEGRYLLVRMVVTTLIESVALLSMRNHLNYSVGGMNVGINDKAPLMMNFLQYYKASTDQLLQRMKTAININSILGSEHYGMPSEYWIVNSNLLQF